MANIIDLAKGLFTDNVLSNASASLGESQSNVSKAVDGIVPSILAGLLNKAGSGGGLSSLINNSSELTSGSGNLSDMLGGALSGGSNSSWLSKGASLLQSIFGGRLGNISNLISGFSGVKESSSSSLLSLAVPAILGLIGRHGGSDEKGILGFLNGQKENILGAVPSGLNLSSALGLGSLSELSNKVSSAYSSVGDSVKNVAGTTTQYVEDKKKGGGGWLWILLLALAALALWYFLKDGCNKPAETPVNDTAVHDTTTTTTTTTTTVTNRYDTATHNYIYDVGALKDIKLPDGTVINVGENSTEAKLFNFLNDAGMSVDTVDKTKGWITMDRVYFETSKSALTAESQQQLKNIAAILKAFPNAKVKLGGYTDNTGSAATNKKLSADRAAMALGEVVKLGIDKARLASEGYGPEHPICAANDTDECKAQNRRVDIRVTSK